MKKNKHKPQPTMVSSRKAMRKQKRQQKKVNRQEHYLKKKPKNEKLNTNNTPGKYVKRQLNDEDTEKPIKNKKAKVQQPNFHDIVSRERQKEKKETDRLKDEMEERRKTIFLKANEDEDKVIKKLEKQLGLNKTKKKNNFFSGDGLDYLLEVCDRTTQEQIVAAEKHLANVDSEDEFEEDLAAVTGKEINDKKCTKKRKHEETSDSDEDMSEEDLDDNSDEDPSGSDDNDEFDDESNDNSESEEDAELERSRKCKDTQLKTNYERKQDNVKTEHAEKKSKKIINDDSPQDDDIDSDDFDEGSDCEDNVLESDIEKSAKVEDKPEVWEDIYGRTRDTEGNIIKEEKGVYIPPHLRDKGSISDKELIQLKRQMKSVINKLAGTNLHWACTTIENLYSNNSRNSVNTALTDLWIEATVQSSATPDRMVAEHAALVAVLHANVGMEIGAHFLQVLVKKFDMMMRTEQVVENKELDNLVSTLAHLYTFKIYHAALVYDILNRLLDKISEKNVECVLVALRNVGGVLRKEEPGALKTFIHDTQGKISQLSDSAAKGSRIKFLLEVLLAIKNNNFNKVPNYDPTYCEHLKKAIRSIIRRGNYITPLNINLEDLSKAEERGKWWVVGSAWEGGGGGREGPGEGAAAEGGLGEGLLELARQQRMNTDVRRSIFCTIVSAQDYTDAFEKLQRLGLKGRQQRELAPVLLATCLQETPYNAYYAVLARRLCDHDRKHQLSIQFAVWDKIKELEGMTKYAMSNLGQFLTHIILSKALPLSVLKIIEFSDLNKRTVKFMRQVLLGLIMNDDLQVSLEVFQRVALAPKLHMFRESLRLFVQHFLVRNAGRKTSVLSEAQAAALRDRAADVEKILTSKDGRLRL